MKIRATATSWTVAGVGTVVSGLGALAVKKRWGLGALCFGLAHVMLGLLDLTRPTVRNS